PAHKAAVAFGLVERALAEDGEGDVTLVQIGQFADLPGEEGATLTLVGCGAAVVPHVIRDEQLGAALEDIDQEDLSVASDERSRWVPLRHGQPSPRGGDRIALPGVRLLPGAQGVDGGQPFLAGGDRWFVHSSHARTDPTGHKNSSVEPEAAR